MNLRAASSPRLDALALRHRIGRGEDAARKFLEQIGDGASAGCWSGDRAGRAVGVRKEGMRAMKIFGFLFRSFRFQVSGFSLLLMLAVSARAQIGGGGGIVPGVVEADPVAMAVIVAQSNAWLTTTLPSYAVTNGGAAALTSATVNGTNLLSTTQAAATYQPLLAALTTLGTGNSGGLTNVEATTLALRTVATAIGAGSTSAVPTTAAVVAFVTNSPMVVFDAYLSAATANLEVGESTNIPFDVVLKSLGVAWDKANGTLTLSNCLTHAYDIRYSVFKEGSPTDASSAIDANGTRLQLDTSRLGLPDVLNGSTFIDRGGLTNGSTVKIKVFNDDVAVTVFAIGATDIDGRTRVTRVQVVEYP